MISGVLGCLANDGQRRMEHSKAYIDEGQYERHRAGATLTADGKAWTAGDELQKRALLVDIEMNHQIEEPLNSATVHIIAVIASRRLEQHFQLPRFCRTTAAEDLMQLENFDRRGSGR